MTAEPARCFACGAPAMSGADLCTDHAEAELRAAVSDPHAGLERTGPGFYSRESVASPFAPPPPQRTAPAVAPADVPPGEDATAYGRAALAGLASDLDGWLAAGEGRNDCIYRVASRLAQLAADGHVIALVARERAERLAAELCADELAKARDTVRRAFAKVGGAA